MKWFGLLLALFCLIGALTAAPNSGVCNLPQKVGRCFAAIPKFYYDANARECQSFIYGGCDGNGNNFDTKEECDRICKK